MLVKHALHPALGSCTASLVAQAVGESLKAATTCPCNRSYGRTPCPRIAESLYDQVFPNPRPLHPVQQPRRGAQPYPLSPGGGHVSHGLLVLLGVMEREHHPAWSLHAHIYTTALPQLVHPALSKEKKEVGSPALCHPPAIDGAAMASALSNAALDDLAFFILSDFICGMALPYR